jgi:hypothetical protein
MGRIIRRVMCALIGHNLQQGMIYHTARLTWGEWYCSRCRKMVRVNYPGWDRQSENLSTKKEGVC